MAKRLPPSPEGMKWCSKCKLHLPLDRFFSAGRGVLEAYCKPCKLEVRRTNRAARKGQPDLTIAERFWPKVDKRGPDECWPWLAAMSNRGYGAISYQGADVPATRVSVILDGREVPEGLVVDHICKNIGCVNPRHLRVVTQKVNSTENSISPHARNKAKTHCPRGHPYSGANLAIAPYKHPRTGSMGTTRVCLTCFPTHWAYAVIERSPPRLSRRKWLGPYNLSSGRTQS